MGPSNHLNCSLHKGNFLWLEAEEKEDSQDAAEERKDRCDTAGSEMDQAQEPKRGWEELRMAPYKEPAK